MAGRRGKVLGGDPTDTQDTEPREMLRGEFEDLVRSTADGIRRRDPLGLSADPVQSVVALMEHAFELGRRQGREEVKGPLSASQKDSIETSREPYAYGRALEVPTRELELPDPERGGEWAQLSPKLQRMVLGLSPGKWVNSPHLVDKDEKLQCLAYVVVPTLLRGKVVRIWRRMDALGRLMPSESVVPDDLDVSSLMRSGCLVRLDMEPLGNCFTLSATIALEVSAVCRRVATRSGFQLAPSWADPEVVPRWPSPPQLEEEPVAPRRHAAFASAGLEVETSIREMKTAIAPLMGRGEGSSIAIASVLERRLGTDLLEEVRGRWRPEKVRRAEEYLRWEGMRKASEPDSVFFLAIDAASDLDELPENPRAPQRIRSACGMEIPSSQGAAIPLAIACQMSIEDWQNRAASLSEPPSEARLSGAGVSLLRIPSEHQVLLERDRRSLDRRGAFELVPSTGPRIYNRLEDALLDAAIIDIESQLSKVASARLELFCNVPDKRARAWRVVVSWHDELDVVSLMATVSTEARVVRSWKTLDHFELPIRVPSRAVENRWLKFLQRLRGISSKGLIETCPEDLSGSAWKGW